MIISDKTIEKLRNLINEETEHRTGPKLVSFFNNYGFRDSYGNGFPSRGSYTMARLKAINGTPELDKCIKDLFAPVNFIDRFAELDKCIISFNKYLSFDGWNVIRNNTTISIVKVKEINLENEASKEKININEEDFLRKEFNEINISTLPIDGAIIPFLEARFQEIEQCLYAKASLATIFLIGSTLEGLLLGIASKFSVLYNKAKAAPKDKATNKVRQFNDWTLSNFIDVSCEVGFLSEDVKKFSHAVRDFRNYIHPYQQMSIGFQPNEHTAIICFQVLKAALFQIQSNNNCKTSKVVRSL